MLTFTPRLLSGLTHTGHARLLYDVFVSRVSQTRDHNRGVKGSMLSSRLLDHVFVYRVSKTRDNKRGVKGSMLSSRLLDHVFVSRVSQTRDNKRGVKVSMLSSRPSGLTHTGHEHII
jgi:hypothetical protein